jgi:hypothetical protein
VIVCILIYKGKRNGTESGTVEVTAGIARPVCAVRVRLLIGRAAREGSGGSRWRLLLWGDDMQNADGITFTMLDAKN